MGRFYVLWTDYIKESFAPELADSTRSMKTGKPLLTSTNQTAYKNTGRRQQVVRTMYLNRQMLRVTQNATNEGCFGSLMLWTASARASTQSEELRVV